MPISPLVPLFGRVRRGGERAARRRHTDLRARRVAAHRGRCARRSRARAAAATGDALPGGGDGRWPLCRVARAGEFGVPPDAVRQHHRRHRASSSSRVDACVVSGLRSTERPAVLSPRQLQSDLGTRAERSPNARRQRHRRGPDRPQRRRRAVLSADERYRRRGREFGGAAEDDCAVCGAAVSARDHTGRTAAVRGAQRAVLTRAPVRRCDRDPARRHERRHARAVCRAGIRDPGHRARARRGGQPPARRAGVSNRETARCFLSTPARSWSGDAGVRDCDLAEWPSMRTGAARMRSRCGGSRSARRVTSHASTRSERQT